MGLEIFMDLNNLKNEFLEKMFKISNLKELEFLKLDFFGREKGKITMVLRNLKNLGEEERKKVGAQANSCKKELEEILNKKSEELKKKESENKLKKDWFDITAPGEKILKGALHPITKTIDEIQNIFCKMGFEVADGPEVETEFYNFDALNIPADHPAREMHDTFWLKEPKNNLKSLVLRSISATENGQISNLKIKEKLLLRTHTSPVQIRYMMTHNPPIRIIAPGRTFRYEAVDASHSHTFYQFECLMVDNDINVANFKAVVLNFFQKFFKRDIKIRLRPSYFPFVEPGFEVDFTCVFCGGKGCGVCKQSGWLEIGGAGMVHPNVFKAVGYNPREVQGFALGFGIERIAMLKYKIPEFKLFYSGDLRFLKQF